MKTVLIILVLLIAGYYWYNHEKGPAANKAPVATDPYYFEVRATNVIEGRELEFALFARARRTRLRQRDEGRLVEHREGLPDVQTAGSQVFEGIAAALRAPVRRRADPVGVPQRNGRHRARA